MGLFSKEERDKEIVRIYNSAPKHLKGKKVQDIKAETGLSRGRIYQIIQGSGGKKDSNY